MNGFGFNASPNAYSSDNPLAQLLKPYLAQQQSETRSETEPQRANGNAVPYEINSQAELEYIVPDKSGRKQIVDCPSENKVYVGRYNHVRQLMDWRSYIDEGEIKLSQKNDTSAEMSQIAEALVAVANKIEAMHSEIQELKNAKPEISETKKVESNRKSNGQFKKRGED